MSPLRSRRAKGRRALDFYQKCKLRLGYEYGPFPPAFESEADERAAWFEFRPELLERGLERGFHGTRPWAFWAYEHPDLLEDDGTPIDPAAWGITLDAPAAHAAPPQRDYRDDLAREERLQARRLWFLAESGELASEEIEGLLNPDSPSGHLRPDQIRARDIVTRARRR